ncbi:adenylate cyclase associated N terminal-domain-containing protein [Gigaspora rosea]|uniref:Adenylyl cyclase-associated protein n=1 Tax=Gigaspora rosea TaxID=44941 RepID=A0A397V430_9GLOM|nr:adenylate cyclase associated N terminal-domain-containing protein [Gigaspora rosea]
MAEFQLTALIKRLETATSRLEELATSGTSAVAVAGSLGRDSNGNQPTEPSNILAGNGTASETKFSASLDAYDELIEGPLNNFIELSKSIGGIVQDQSHSVEDIFIAQRDFISISTQSTKPKTSDTLVELFRPTQQALEKVCAHTENNRISPFNNHLKTVSEGIGVLSWVTFEETAEMEEKLLSTVKGLIESSQYYANRVIKEFKDKDRSHVDWANSYIHLLTGLQQYITKFHTHGLIWNPKGSKPETFIDRKPVGSKSTSSPTSSSVPGAPPPPTSSSVPGAPPPPPPPPPPPQILADDNPTNKSPADMSAVFKEINRGEDITSSLKKVDKSQMTHKNPNLRSVQKKGPAAPPKPASLSTKKPPKKEFDNNKWIIENYENDYNIVIEETAINHTVYIFGCKNSTISVKGKIKAVTLGKFIHSCQKTGLLVDSAVATVDIVNCKSFQLQIQGKVPVIAVDKTDSGQIYLSEECFDVEVFTAKSSSINIQMPTSDGDFEEKPIPEQLKCTIVDRKLVFVPVEHAG